MNDFIKEFTKTKEMAFAWIFRTGLAALIVVCGGILNMAWGTLQELRQDLKHTTELEWTAISTLTANQNQQAANAAVISTTLADHIKQEATVLDDIHAEVKDHETRIRTLETAHVR